MPDLFDLTGRVAAVTGGSSGVGQAIATALGSAGASIVVIARRADALADTAEAIEKTGGKAAAVEANLATYTALDQVAEEISKPFGGPDVLVNAAGINLRQPVDEITPESWDQTIAINLGGPLFSREGVGASDAAQGMGPDHQHCVAAIRTRLSPTVFPTEPRKGVWHR